MPTVYDLSSRVIRLAKITTDSLEEAAKEVDNDAQFYTLQEHQKMKEGYANGLYYSLMASNFIGIISSLIQAPIDEEKKKNLTALLKYHTGIKNKIEIATERIKEAIEFGIVISLN